MIILQQFDDKFGDYWDSEQEAYIVYAGDSKAGFDIKTKEQIKDFDGFVCDCWLYKAEYIPQLDCYELTYKTE